MDKVEDIAKVGDEITVQVTEIDNMGRVNLSRRAISKDLPQESGAEAKNPPSGDYPFKKRGEGNPSRHSSPSKNIPRH